MCSQLPRIIIDYNNQALLTEAFAISEHCDRALCQHDTTDLVFLLIDSSKLWRTHVAAVDLVKVEVEKTSHFQFFGELGYAKKDCPSKKKYELTMEKPKRKAIDEGGC